MTFYPFSLELRLECDFRRAQAEVLNVEGGNVRVQFFYLRAQAAILSVFVGIKNTNTNRVRLGSLHFTHTSRLRA